tara:strand:+ start:795 stop:1142 length:348 start_codon:yes stop_codon:yes gene_type:complete
MVEKLRLNKFSARLFCGDVDSTRTQRKVAAEVTIYTTMFCPYCSRAKNLLDVKGAAFEEVAVDMDAAKRVEMIERSGGGHTVPQIFINDRHVGGSDELADLERTGELDSLLAVAP